MSTAIKLRAPANGQLGNFTAVSVAEVKNGVANVMSMAADEGLVAVTKHGQVKMVMLPIEAYEALVTRAGDPLEKLSARYEEMLAHMQTDAQRAGEDALFDALPAAKPTLRVR